MSGNNKSKSKKILFTILVIVVIVALGLIVYQYSGYKAGTKVQEGAGTEEGVEEIPPVSEGTPYNGEGSEKMTEIDIIRNAILNQDMSFCESFEDADVKNRCENSVILAEAKTKEDSTVCDRIENEGIRGICKDEVIFVRAINSKDSSICEEITNQTRIEQCKSTLASL